MTQGSAAFHKLLATLSLEETGADSYRGPGSGHDQYGLFGGHLLGQGASAAYRSVDADRHLHAVHALFLRGGDGMRDVDYRVERVRDGRAFCTRRVVGSQDGKELFEMTASFHRPEMGEELAPDPPELPDPTAFPTFAECMANQEGDIFGEQWSRAPRPVEYRLVHAPWAPSGASPEGGICFWFRVEHALPDDPWLHHAILAYHSDETAADNLLVPFGAVWNSPGTLSLSLDHALWFHRPLRVDDWLYVEQKPVTASGARGLASGRVWARDGSLVASFAQEALFRLDKD